MRRTILVVGLFIALAVALVIGTSRIEKVSDMSKAPSAPADTRPVIAVTSRSIYDMAARVAGDSFRVVQVLPSGANPHTFEPTPSAMRTLESAKVVYAVGHGLDGWIDALVSETGVPKVTVDAGIAIKQSGDEGDDPHYWLTMANARVISSNIAADLEKRFPDGSPALRGNLKGYQDELDAADAKIRDILSGVKNRQVVTLHDAWYYFADAYGLQIVGTFEPTAGREPTPRWLADLSNAVTKTGVHTLYAEPGLSLSSLDAFAQDKGLKIVTVDPGEGASDRPYIDLMIENAQILRDNQ